VADYDSALVSLTADVANSYITIRTLERRIEIAHQNVETQKDSLNIAEARLKYGTITQLDVEQARTALNDTLATIPSLEAQLRQARHALSILLGRPPSELSDYLGSTSVIPISPLVWWSVSLLTCCSAGPTFGVPSIRRQRKALKSEWPKQTFIQPFPDGKF
jgi:outer membrane protein TolC